MKSKLQNSKSGIGCSILFILPFLIIGIGTLYLGLKGIYLQAKTLNWIALEAQVNSVDFETTYNDDTITEEVKCIYTYIYKNKNYTKNTISIGYGSNNTENHRELYSVLQYANKLTVYINPDEPNDSTLVKGTNSSTISLLLFSILWNGFILVFYKVKKYKILAPIFILIFISVIIIFVTGMIHTDFKARINILDKKSDEEIERIKEKEWDRLFDDLEKEENL